MSTVGDGKEQRDRAFMLVSVRSSVFSARWTETKAALQRLPLAITYVLLDALEVYNAIMHSDAAESGENEALLLQLRARLQETGAREIRTWTEIEEGDHFSPYLTAVKEQFALDTHFRREVINQSFRNLQPRLRSLGVKNSRDGRMAVLAQYLLHEIACKLYLSQSRFGGFSRELLSFPEMGVMTSIYQGRYQQLSPLVRRLPTYVAVDGLWCATFREDQPS